MPNSSPKPSSSEHYDAPKHTDIPPQQSHHVNIRTSAPYGGESNTTVQPSNGKPSKTTPEEFDYVTNGVLNAANEADTPPEGVIIPDNVSIPFNTNTCPSSRTPAFENFYGVLSHGYEVATSTLNNSVQPYATQNLLEETGNGVNPFATPITNTQSLSSRSKVAKLPNTSALVGSFTGPATSSSSVIPSSIQIKLNNSLPTTLTATNSTSSSHSQPQRIPPHPSLHPYVPPHQHQSLQQSTTATISPTPHTLDTSTTPQQPHNNPPTSSTECIQQPQPPTQSQPSHQTQYGQVNYHANALYQHEYYTVSNDQTHHNLHQNDEISHLSNTLPPHHPSNYQPQTQLSSLKSLPHNINANSAISGNNGYIDLHYNTLHSNTPPNIHNPQNAAFTQHHIGQHSSSRVPHISVTPGPHQRSIGQYMNVQYDQPQLQQQHSFPQNISSNTQCVAPQTFNDGVYPPPYYILDQTHDGQESTVPPQSPPLSNSTSSSVIQSSSPRPGTIQSAAYSGAPPQQQYHQSKSSQQHINNNFPLQSSPGLTNHVPGLVTSPSEQQHTPLHSQHIPYTHSNPLHASSMQPYNQPSTILSQSPSGAQFTQNVPVVTVIPHATYSSISSGSANFQKSPVSSPQHVTGSSGSVILLDQHGQVMNSISPASAEQRYYNSNTNPSHHHSQPLHQGQGNAPHTHNTYMALARSSSTQSSVYTHQYGYNASDNGPVYYHQQQQQPHSHLQLQHVGQPLLAQTHAPQQQMHQQLQPYSQPQPQAALQPQSLQTQLSYPQYNTPLPQQQFQQEPLTQNQRLQQLQQNPPNNFLTTEQLNKFSTTLLRHDTQLISRLDHPTGFPIDSIPPEAYKSLISVKFLPISITDADLLALFQSFGPVQFHCIQFPAKQHSTPFAHGLVGFATPEQAQSAILSMDRVNYSGRVLKVQFYDPNSPPEPAPHQAEREKENIYIANLPPHWQRQDLAAHFSNLTQDPLTGELIPKRNVITSKILLDVNGVSRNIGFVQFSCVEEAHLAILENNGKVLVPGCDPAIVRYARDNSVDNYKTNNQNNRMNMTVNIGNSTITLPPNASSPGSGMLSQMGNGYLQLSAPTGQSTLPSLPNAILAATSTTNETCITIPNTSSGELSQQSSNSQVSQSTPFLPTIQTTSTIISSRLQQAASIAQPFIPTPQYAKQHQQQQEPSHDEKDRYNHSDDDDVDFHIHKLSHESNLREKRKQDSYPHYNDRRNHSPQLPPKYNREYNQHRDGYINQYNHRPRHHRNNHQNHREPNNTRDHKDNYASFPSNDADDTTTRAVQPLSHGKYGMRRNNSSIDSRKDGQIGYKDPIATTTTVNND